MKYIDIKNVSSETRLFGMADLYKEHGECCVIDGWHITTHYYTYNLDDHTYTPFSTFYAIVPEFDDTSLYLISKETYDTGMKNGLTIQQIIEVASI